MHDPSLALSAALLLQWQAVIVQLRQTEWLGAEAGDGAGAEAVVEDVGQQLMKTSPPQTVLAPSRQHAPVRACWQAGTGCTGFTD